MHSLRGDCSGSVGSRRIRRSQTWTNNHRWSQIHTWSRYPRIVSWYMINLLYCSAVICGLLSSSNVQMVLCPRSEVYETQCMSRSVHNQDMADERFVFAYTFVCHSATLNSGRVDESWPSLLWGSWVFKNVTRYKSNLYQSVAGVSSHSHTANLESTPRAYDFVYSHHTWISTTDSIGHNDLATWIYVTSLTCGLTCHPKR